MKIHHDPSSDWPDLRLAVFVAADWPALPGEVETCCECSHCFDTFGPPPPAGHSEADARRRWQTARLAALTQGSDRHVTECLDAQREDVATLRGRSRRTTRTPFGP